VLATDAPSDGAAHPLEERPVADADEERGEPARPATGATPGDATAAELFGLLWDTMADVLGTAATATLLRRALKRAARGRADLGGVAIERDDLSYGYRLPETWREGRDGAAVGALRHLVGALEPLLVEMTGPVVVRRLAQVAALRPLSTAPGEEANA
jgi:hypothetical protein